LQIYFLKVLVNVFVMSPACSVSERKKATIVVMATTVDVLITYSKTFQEQNRGFDLGGLLPHD